MVHNNCSFLILLLAFLVSCKLPDQPELTKEEKSFFDSMKMYNISMKREIDPELLMRNSTKEGTYTLSVLLPYSNLDKDSLNAESYRTALYLYERILKKNNRYNTITINYDIKTGSDQYKSSVFKYVIEKNTLVQTDAF